MAESSQQSGFASEPLSFKKRRQSSSAAPPRASFSSILRNRLSWAPSLGSVTRQTEDEDAFTSQLGHKEALPGLIPRDIKPLPLIPLLSLCLAMLSEFLSASTPAAFLFFQIQSFYVPEGETPADGIEAMVSLWSGIVGSSFFLSQFLTSLLWAEIEKKHGCRAVLIASLAGNAVCLTLFGFSKNLAFAIVARLGQGLFAGAIGCARSAVKNITVESNESQAYTLVGLAWGLGGIVGSIIGGLAEHPARNYPRLFKGNQLFVTYPYLLPCLISSSITLAGAVLCLFLGRDGGPRDGAIRLPIEKLTEQGQMSDPETTPKARAASLANRSSGYFPQSSASPTPRLSKDPSSQTLRRPSSASYGTNIVSPSLAGLPENAAARLIPRANSRGAGYGYDSSKRLSRPWSRRLTMDSTARRGSNMTNAQSAQDVEEDQAGPDLSSLNFAQRLLLANEPAVLNISDLWVQACAAQAFDEEDDGEASQADFDTSVFDRDDDEQSTADVSVSGGFNDYGEEDETPLMLPGYGLPPRRSSVASRAGSRLGVGSVQGELRPRLVSRTSNGPGIQSRPRIFSNTGLQQPPALFSPAAETPPSLPAPNSNDFNALETIPEQRQHGELSPVRASAPLLPETAAPVKESPFKDLPMGLILQYFITAFHSTGCDQVFNTFLVTPVASGGLGLTASHFAELVAVLFFAQMFWQFKVYGNLGPPNGTYSHLAMLRIAMCIYIPCYLLFPYLRGLLHETSDFFVMTGMIILASIRILGNVCAYTALMVLVNASTPPHLLGLSNALAQSTASAARFFGPVIGASLWSWSIALGPEGRMWPFTYHFAFLCMAAVCFVGLVLSARLR